MRVSCGALAASLFLVGTAAADWPMPRHDAARTALATGSSNVTTPAVYWRAHLGGVIGPASALGLDVDGDGAAEIVFFAAGKLVARRADGSTAWETSQIGIVGLDGAADLDGDGKPEVIAHSGSQAHIFRGSDGLLLWREPEEDFGTLGGLRVFDVDGDGRKDLVVQECSCCEVANGKTGYAYSFAAGFPKPKLLWTMPSVECGGSNSMTFMNLEATGKSGFVIGGYSEMSLVDGSSGKALASTGGMGTRIALSKCRAVNVDGIAGDELACALSTNVAAPGEGHRLFLLKYSSAPPTFGVVWSKLVGELDGAASVGPGFVDDLDGDGLVELTVGGALVGTVGVVQIHDGKTGQELAIAHGETLVGTGRLGAIDRSLLLTSKGDVLSAWSFDRKSSPSLQLSWKLPDRRALRDVDPVHRLQSAVSARFVTPDLSGDGLGDLLTTDLAGSTLYAYSVTGGTPKLLGTWAFPPAVSEIATWLMPPLNGTHPQVVSAGSDGAFRIFSSNLAPTGPTVRFGGFYSEGGWGQLTDHPLIAKLGPAGSSVLAVDSRGALRRFDVSDASLATNPKAVWTREQTSAPVVVGGLDGTEPGIACRAVKHPVTVPPSHQLVALNASGNPIWIQPIDGTPFNDPVPGLLDGDAVPDFVVQWGLPTDVLIRTRGISGATGATLWNGAPTGSGPTRAPAGLAVADWNGDGRSDAVFQHYGTHVYSGTSGEMLASGGPVAIPYAMPTLFDLDSNTDLDVILHGGFYPRQAWSHDLSKKLWESTQDDKPFPYAAVVPCAGTGPRLVGGSLAYPSRLQVTVMSGLAAGSVNSHVLAGGKIFADEGAAKAAGVFLGQLTSVAAHVNLTGKGYPSALVGSTDGWLYAINPCAGGLEFAMDFGSPVGAIAIGDTDGDGNDDFIASVGDGYLYGVKQPPIAAPTFAWDTDPAHGINDVDVDDVETADSLSAKWGAVSGATNYQVAVVRASTEEFGTVPPWTDVGSVTTATVDQLALIDGEKYTFAVRAMKGKGASPAALTDGVTVHSKSQGDSGADATIDSGTEAPTDAGADSPAPGEAGAPADILSGRACTCSVPGRSLPSAPWRARAILLVAVPCLLRRYGIRSRRSA